ncbi:MAG: hypothetical protein CM1200mP7_3240 [Chloroflexota bacterium]|nr:MAG: hypothetical protein CM1200mP7_3240 [Chloroflexota bacterium]
MWELSENLEVTYFGISASFIQSCINEKIHPGEKFDLSKIKSIGSTGSPLSVDCFDWISTEIGEHVLINSCSGVLIYVLLLLVLLQLFRYIWVPSIKITWS